MFGFKKKKVKKPSDPTKDAEFAHYQTISSGQRAPIGDRSELCAGAMNNNQRLATLQMLRNTKDTD